jgi:transcriptional regulator with GAF, ATPase, and Fis domain
VNCAAIPSELIESELFGHVKGAFTSAVKDRAGKFEAANGGTIFLDEIGDMSLSAQAKVLRALQENLIQSIEPNTFLCIETRSITDKDQHRTFGDTHYRNLTDMDYLVELLQKYHFTILYSIESKDLAVYKDENPTCIRIICKN